MAGKGKPGVRKPATKFPHLKKQMVKNALAKTPPRQRPQGK